MHSFVPVGWIGSEVCAVVELGVRRVAQHTLRRTRQKTLRHKSETQPYTIYLCYIYNLYMQYVLELLKIFEMDGLASKPV